MDGQKGEKIDKKYTDAYDRKKEFFSNAFC